jgi:hypothetical protein
MFDVINKNIIWIYDISHYGSHVGNVTQILGKISHLTDMLEVIKIEFCWTYRGVDRKVFIVGFNFYKQQFLTVITQVRLGRFTV